MRHQRLTESACGWGILSEDTELGRVRVAGPEEAVARAIQGKHAGQAPVLTTCVEDREPSGSVSAPPRGDPSGAQERRRGNSIRKLVPFLLDGADLVRDANQGGVELGLL